MTEHDKSKIKQKEYYFNSTVEVALLLWLDYTRGLGSISNFCVLSEGDDKLVTQLLRIRTTSILQTGEDQYLEAVNNFYSETYVWKKIFISLYNVKMT